MKPLFITGTDTGIGKTVFAAWLTWYLRNRGAAVAALKPICSGGRDDARLLHAAMDGELSLDEINRWHFRAPIAPMLAAQRENKSVGLSQVVAHVRRVQKKFPLLVIEGAGGLLSPLGRDFDSRVLIETLNAVPIIVAANRLGAINQVLLVVEALRPGQARDAKVVLMSESDPDSSVRDNPAVLRQRLGNRVFILPRLKFPERVNAAIADRRVSATLKAVCDSVPLHSRNRSLL